MTVQADKHFLPQKKEKKNYASVIQYLFLN